MAWAIGTSSVPTIFNSIPYNTSSVSSTLAQYLAESESWFARSLDEFLDKLSRYGVSQFKTAEPP